MTTVRFLADENFPADIVTLLRLRGFDVVHMATEKPGALDTDVVELARLSGSVLLTFDPDFGRMIFHEKSQPAPGIVLFRFPPQSLPVMNAIIDGFFDQNPTLVGFFTVVSPSQFRQAPLG